jgi:hypothetical protein
MISAGNATLNVRHILRILALDIIWCLSAVFCVALFNSNHWLVLITFMPVNFLVLYLRDHKIGDLYNRDRIHKI